MLNEVDDELRKELCPTDSRWETRKTDVRKRDCPDRSNIFYVWVTDCDLIFVNWRQVTLMEQRRKKQGWKRSRETQENLGKEKNLKSGLPGDINKYKCHWSCRRYLRGSRVTITEYFGVYDTRILSYLVLSMPAHKSLY